LGILLMTENYLTFNELGIIPNFAHYNVDTLVTDTANWVHVASTIVADSAYQYVAFGNFFDDDNTLVELIDPDDPDPSNLAYYYFDDFCVVPAGGECDVVLNAGNYYSVSERIQLFPNPVRGALNIRYDGQLKAVRILSMDGQLLQPIGNINNQSKGLTQITLSGYPTGIYFVEIETEEGIAREKIVIQP
jgi:hypothetical protein